MVAIDLVLIVPATVAVLRAPEPLTRSGGLWVHLTGLSARGQMRGFVLRACLIGIAGFVVVGLRSAMAPATLGELKSACDCAGVGMVPATFSAVLSVALSLPVVVGGVSARSEGLPAAGTRPCGVVEAFPPAPLASLLPGVHAGRAA